MPGPLYVRKDMAVAVVGDRKIAPEDLNPHLLLIG